MSEIEREASRLYLQLSRFAARKDEIWCVYGDNRSGIDRFVELVRHPENPLLNFRTLKVPRDLGICSFRDQQELFEKGLTPIGRVTALQREEARLEGDIGRLEADIAQISGQSIFCSLRCWISNSPAGLNRNTENARCSSPSPRWQSTFSQVPISLSCSSTRIRPPCTL